MYELRTPGHTTNYAFLHPSTFPSGIFNGSKTLHFFTWFLVRYLPLVYS